jgi:hypothetical protein
MGFNWLYLNPVFYPGFSGSVYAIKHTDRLHPALTPDDNRTDVEQLRPVLQQVRLPFGLFPDPSLLTGTETTEAVQQDKNSLQSLFVSVRP